MYFRFLTVMSQFTEEEAKGSVICDTDAEKAEAAEVSKIKQQKLRT